MRSFVVVSFASLVACGSPGTDPDPAAVDGAVVTDARPAADADIDGVPYGGADVTGDWLLAIRPGNAPAGEPARWFQFVATWVLDRDAWEIRGTYLPLCRNGCAVERSTVPPALPHGDSLLAEWGGNYVSFSGALPAAANPVADTAAQFSVLLDGRSRGPDLVCGFADVILGGAELGNGTFAAQRITSTDPASLPAPLAACPD